MTPTVRRITAAREPLWNLTLAGPRMFCAAQLDYPALVALLVACQDAVAQHRRATEETTPCREEIGAETDDLWRRDPLAASIRQRVRPRHQDDDEGGAHR